MSTDATSPVDRYEYIRYEDPRDAYRPYDERFPDVACRVAELIRDRFPAGEIEHVGSTAIPGCPGKGVIDLMLLYGPGMLASARNAVDSLGFQRHDRPGAFPEERPVRIGSIVHDSDRFRLHVHIIAIDSPEVAEQRRFRDQLRDDPKLVEEYAARKRAVLEAGATDGNDYNLGKDSFIKFVLGRDCAEPQGPN